MPRMTISRSRLCVALAWALPLAVPAVAGAQEAQRPATHTVRRGDTLWDLARQYLGDPFLWPQIYRLNTDVVEDPHWIYPGEVLRLVPGEGVRAVPGEDTPAPDQAAEPQAEAWAEYPMPEFAQRQPGTQMTALRAYTDPDYYALRSGEFYSAAFLTEERPLPYGAVLGPVTPPQIRNLTERQSASIWTTIGVQAPDGGSYATGDTLLVLQRENGWSGYGDIVVPTGLVRVTGQAGRQYTAEVVALFGPVRQDQEVLPAERFAPGPKAQPVPATEAFEGRVLGGRHLRELKVPQSQLFLDVGRDAGVRPGDVFEIRRRPGPRDRGADSIDELMATGQVVHVGARSATLLLIRVIQPDIAPGTPARRVARLPG